MVSFVMAVRTGDFVTASVELLSSMTLSAWFTGVIGPIAVLVRAIAGDIVADVDSLKTMPSETSDDDKDVDETCSWPSLLGTAGWSGYET